MSCRFSRGCSVYVLACALLLAGASGCTYLNNRWSDAKQMMDLGLTFSAKPQFGLYANCPMVTPLGYSKVDGYFVGIGGGKLGAGEHHQNNAGLLFWGREENSWKGFNDEKPTVDATRAGVMGIAENVKEGKANYRPACIHYLHIGFVGVMWNLNYFKMADFFCGWFGYIPFGDRSRRIEERQAKAEPPPQPQVAQAPPPAAPPVPSPPPTPEAVPVLRPPTPAPAAPKPREPVSAAAQPRPRVPDEVSLALARDIEAVKAAPLVPRTPDEVSLALARDVQAAKAELAALRRDRGAAAIPKLPASGSAQPAPARPAGPRFALAELVP